MPCALCDDFGLVVVGRDEYMLNCPECDPSPPMDPVEFDEDVSMLSQIEWIDYQRANGKRLERQKAEADD